MTSKNALLSLTSGVTEKYIFQVIKVTKLSDKIIRLTLSDGNAYISADIEAIKLKESTPQYSLVKVQLKYYGLGHPAEISTLQIVQKSYKFILGKPIPFIDYINQGFISEEDMPVRENYQEKTRVVQKPKFFRGNEQEEARVISVEQNDDSQPLLFVAQNDIDPYVPIQVLEPKMSYWKILGRIGWIDYKMILVKAGMKSGQKVLVLNFFVIDKSGKQIKCSCFDQAANKFRPLLHKGSVYQFSNGKIFEELQQTTNRRFINIRFQVFSTITEIQNPMYQIPRHSYNLVTFDKIPQFNDEQELDVAGIVKTILRKQQSNSTKLKITLVILDPILRKEIDAVLYMQPDEARSVIEHRPIVLKNIKIVTAEQGTISLRSCFNSHYIFNFEEEQQVSKTLRPFLQKDFEKQNYESLSKINYKQRNLSQHLHALQLCTNQQRIFSKVNCYFVGPFGQRKYYYDACVKCLKKVNSDNRRSNFCQKCRKIVQVREQYLLKSQFVDWTKQIKLTLVGDYAKSILKKQAPQFVKLGFEQQTQYLNSLRFTQVCLYLKSWKIKDNFNHNVQIIQKPHFQGLLKIQRILAGIKEE